MSRYGQPAYCHICEKIIPHRAKCQMCGKNLCFTCQCTCPLSQPGAAPMDPRYHGTVKK